MKKIFILLFCVMLFSCTANTTPSEDTMMLQKKYTIVYPQRNSSMRYVCIDTSGGIWDVKVDLKGNVESAVRIK